MIKSSAVRRPQHKRDILWIEDYPSSWNDLVTGLSQLGNNVVVASDYSQVSAKVLNSYDCLIIDNKLSERSLNYGIELANRLAAERSVRIVIFSAYLTRDQVNNLFVQIDETNSYIMYIPKNPIEVTEVEEYYRNIYNSIDKFFDGADPSSLADLVRPTRVAAMGTQYTYAEFCQLRLSDKAAYYEQFQDRVAKSLSKEFARGASWVLFFDGNTEPAHVARSVSEILPKEQITRRAIETDRVPFIFRDDLRIDDCSASGPGGDQIKDYPRVTLNIEGRDLQFHFDTGADTSLLNEQFVTEIGTARWDQHDVQSVLIQTRRHVCQGIEFDALVADPASKASGFGLKIKGLAVADWAKSSLYVNCSQTCALGNADGCLFRRNGLVGRSLYAGKSLTITLRGDSNMVSIAEVDE